MCLSEETSATTKYERDNTYQTDQVCSDMGYAKDEPGGGEKRMLKQFQVVSYHLDVWYLGPIVQAKE